MTRRVDYTIPTQLPEIRSNRPGTSVLYPTDTSLNLMLVTSSPGNPFPDIVSTMAASTIAVMSTFPGAPLDWNKLITVAWHSDGDGMVAGSGGEFAPNLSSNTSKMFAGSYGSVVTAELLSSNTSTMVMASLGRMWTDAEKLNWIAWSDVGSLDFTQSRKNVAGAMPMDWQGAVYGIQKHGKVFIVMGLNGVSIVTPTGALMGLNTIHSIGLIGRDAFAGNDSVLYFVDKLGCLYQLTDTLKKLDYREFLSGLSNLTLTFDESTKFLYICNGTKGYVYSQESDSFGAGPVNITGSGYKTGVLYLTSPAAIATPVFEICTDVYDFGTRKIKSIYNLDFGTDSSGVFQAAVEYRKVYDTAFTSTAWKNIHNKGDVKIVCHGSEFRFKFKVTTYKAFELDYFNVDYKVHAH